MCIRDRICIESSRVPSISKIALRSRIRNLTDFQNHGTGALTAAANR